MSAAALACGGALAASAAAEPSIAQSSSSSRSASAAPRSSRRLRNVAAAAAEPAPAATDPKQRYMARGVSADKEDVHAAIANVDKGLFPKAFCKVVPDLLTGDEDYCTCMVGLGVGYTAVITHVVR